jgi:hypothetical protein
VERLHQWSHARHPADEGQLTWLAQTLPALAHALHAAASGIGMTAALVQERWAWLQEHIARARAHTGSGRTRALAATGPALLGLIRASHDARDSQTRQHIIGTLLSGDLPLQTPLGVLHAARAQALDVAGLGLMPVHAHCAQAFSARLAEPERAADDWSITPPAECARIAEQELSAPLARFLSSPTQRRLEWPLAEPRRRVIHQFIERHELPVKHETRRSGRPYTLVLEKTPALFQREAAERKQWAEELAWLHKK